MQPWKKYLTSSASMAAAMALSVFSSYMMRKILHAGIPQFTALLCRQAICLIPIISVMLYKRISPFSPNTRVHVLKSLTIPVADFLWIQALASSIPLYLCGFMSLVICVFGIIIARFTLNEVWCRSYWVLLLSVLSILFHGFNPEYGHAVWILILGCVIYSGLDSLNSKLMKRGKGNFMSHVLQNEHEEQVEVISFWDNAISFAVYLIFAFASPFPSPDKFLTVWPLILGCGLSIAGVLPLILTAYSLQNISSLQFIRIVEPLLAGILIDLDGIPVHMLVCISVFGLASLYGFGKNLGLF